MRPGDFVQRWVGPACGARAASFCGWPPWGPRNPVGSGCKAMRPAVSVWRLARGGARLGRAGAEGADGSAVGGLARARGGGGPGGGVGGVAEVMRRHLEVGPLTPT